jgi:hypothetical protein
VETAIQERMRLSHWQFVQFEKLGLSIFDAAVAVDEGLDYHDVEKFLKDHPSCNVETAIKILR